MLSKKKKKLIVLLYSMILITLVLRNDIFSWVLIGVGRNRNIGLLPSYLG